MHFWNKKQLLWYIVSPPTELFRIWYCFASTELFHVVWCPVMLTFPSFKFCYFRLIFDLQQGTHKFEVITWSSWIKTSTPSFRKEFSETEEWSCQSKSSRGCQSKVSIKFRVPIPGIHLFYAGRLPTPT